MKQKINAKIQADAYQDANREYYLSFIRITNVSFSNGVGYVNIDLPENHKVIRAFSIPENVIGVVITSCQAQTTQNRIEMHCVNIADGTPYTGSTVGYINLLFLISEEIG